MAFSNLTSTSTFTQWYEQTNLMTTFLNEQIVANGQVAYGIFTFGANANVSVCNTVVFAEALLNVNTNVSIGWAQSAVSFLSNTFTVSSNNILLNPITGLTVNSPMTVNATAVFTQNVAAVNVAVSGTLAASLLAVSGNAVFSNGTLTARQVLFTATGATVSATLAAAGYADHDVTGLEDASVYYATPTNNTVISGMQGHTAVTSSTDGARVLLFQNLSTTKKVTFSAANSSSTAQHQFETIGNLDVDVLPRQTAFLIYSKAAQRWRVVGGTTAPGGAAAFGNTAITGTFAASGNTTLFANLAAAPLYVNQVTGRVGIGTAAPSVLFHSAGPNLLEDITTAVQLRTSFLNVSSNAIFTTGQFYANGVAAFTKNITVAGTDESYITKLRANSFTSDTNIIGVALSGVTGTFSGALSTAVDFLPAADAAQRLGSALKRWIYPFFVLQNGVADAGMTAAVLTGASGELKSLAGYTGSINIQGVAPDGGPHLFTIKGGIIVSIS